MGCQRFWPNHGTVLLALQDSIPRDPSGPHALTLLQEAVRSKAGYLDLHHDWTEPSHVTPSGFLEHNHDMCPLRITPLIPGMNGLRRFVVTRAVWDARYGPMSPGCAASGQPAHFGVLTVGHQANGITNSKRVDPTPKTHRRCSGHLAA